MIKISNEAGLKKSSSSISWNDLGTNMEEKIVRSVVRGIMIPEKACKSPNSLLSRQVSICQRGTLVKKDSSKWQTTQLIPDVRAIYAGIDLLEASVVSFSLALKDLRCNALMVVDHLQEYLQERTTPINWETDDTPPYIIQFNKDHLTRLHTIFFRIQEQAHDLFLEMQKRADFSTQMTYLSEELQEITSIIRTYDELLQENICEFQDDNAALGQKIAEEVQGHLQKMQGLTSGVTTMVMTTTSPSSFSKRNTSYENRVRTRSSSIPIASPIGKQQSFHSFSCFMQLETLVARTLFEKFFLSNFAIVQKTYSSVEYDHLDYLQWYRGNRASPFQGDIDEKTKEVLNFLWGLRVLWDQLDTMDKLFTDECKAKFYKEKESYKCKLTFLAEWKKKLQKETLLYRELEDMERIVQCRIGDIDQAVQKYEQEELRQENNSKRQDDNELFSLDPDGL